MDERSQSGTAADCQACKRTSGAKACGGGDFAWENEIVVRAKNLMPD